MGKGRRVKRENLRPEMAVAFDGVMKAIFERETDKAEAVRQQELRLETLQGEIAKGEQRVTKAEQAERPDKDWLKRMRTWLDDARRSETNVKATLAELRNEPRRIGGYGKVASSYFKEASKLAGTGDYWTRPTELFARAFEAYVFDRIGEQGQVSQYLVQGVEPERYGSSAYKGNPYPVGLERDAINAAFDKLFVAMQTRETEKGTALYSYLGEKAAKVPQHALAAARSYAQEGISMEEIRKVTGWFRAKDDKWRFEISDEASTFRPGYRKGKTVGDVLEHGVLFDNYPSLANIGIIWRSDLPEKVFGGYSHAENAFHLNGKRTLQEIRSTLLHELQHAVQVIEGFARGGSPHDKAFMSAVAAMGVDVNDRDAVIDAYERLLGEVEARDVQARAALTAEELRERPPYVSQGIPESEFIVRREGDLAADEGPSGDTPSSPPPSQGGGRVGVSPFVRGRAEQKPGPAGLSASGLRETLAKRFGGGVGRLVEAGTLRIVQHESEPGRHGWRAFGEVQDELPAHLNDGKGGIRGVYDPTGHPLTGEGANTAWMVADNLTAADAPGVFLHEIGVHFGLEAMVGGEKYQDIIRQMKALEADGNEAVRAGRAAIPNGTPRAALDDELLAYLVEKHPELPFVKRIIAAIRAFLFRMGLIKNIKPQDVVALAKAAAKHAARTPSYLPGTPSYLPLRKGEERREERREDRGRDPSLPLQKGEFVLYLPKAGLLPARLEGVTPAPAYSGSPLWYSEMAKFIDEKAPGKAPAGQWKTLLANWAKQGKFKGDELEWSGVKEWLDLQEGAVTKDQVLGFVRENGVRVEETKLGGEEVEEYKPDLRELGGYGEMVDEGYEDEETGEWIDPDPETAEYRHVYQDRNNPDSAETYEVIGSDWSGNWLVPDMSKNFSSKDEAVSAIEEHIRMEAAEKQEKERDKEVEGPAKHAQWQLPGGENYREVLLRLPEKKPPPFDLETNKKEWAKAEKAGDQDRMFELAEERKRWLSGKADLESKTPSFTSSHYDQPNILAHVRFNERTDADGKRVLFIEEIQSDWAQKGKREGFKGRGRSVAGHRPGYRCDSILEAYRLDPKLAEDDATARTGRISWDAHPEMKARENALDSERGVQHSVPAAPFVGKTEAWVALALKRMIRHAAENGFDRIAWTTGEQQAERYDLSKQIDRVAYNHATGQLMAWKKGT